MNRHFSLAVQRAGEKDSVVEKSGSARAGGRMQQGDGELPWVPWGRQVGPGAGHGGAPDEEMLTAVFAANATEGAGAVLTAKGAPSHWAVRH